ncbi:methyltransferase family protein [Azospirillum brasilense]|nr:methyltransferase family protein [Azospirillum brasilense]
MDGTEEAPLRCPLSGDTALEEVGAVATQDLVAGYAASYGVDVSALFAGIGRLRLMRSRTSDLMFFTPTVVGDAGFYEQVSRIVWYYTEDKREFAFARDRIAAGSTVLEVGCGPGYFGRILGDCDYRGLEFNKGALARAAAQGLRVEATDVRTLARLQPASFDTVVSFQVMEHVAEVGEFLEGCVALLRPGGTLILSVPSADSFMRFAFNDVLNLPPHHVTWWTDRCLAWCAEAHGMQLMELHHQTLSDGGHRSWFLQQLADRAYLKHLGFGQPGLMVDLDLLARIRALTTPLVQILELGFEDSSMEPRGHTVIAVMRKPEA